MNNFNKRKYEEGKVPPLKSFKRKRMRCNPYKDPPYNPNEPYIYSNTQSEHDWAVWKKSPNKQQRQPCRWQYEEQQSKRYSANDRLTTIRTETERIENEPTNNTWRSMERRRLDSEPTIVEQQRIEKGNRENEFAYSKRQSMERGMHRNEPVNDRQQRYVPSCSSRSSSSPSLSSPSSFVVTAKPSSLEERLIKIKTSANFNNKEWYSRSADLGSREGLPQLLDVMEKRSDASNNNIKKNSTSAFTNAQPFIGLSTQSNSNRSEGTIGFPLLNNSTCNENSMWTPKSTFPFNLPSEQNMEWCEIEEQEVLSNLKELRDTMNTANTKPQTSFQEFVAKEAEEMPLNKTIFRINYVVVDTNIFLSHLNVVKRVMKLKINVTGDECPTILVPWIVIQELDYIKDDRHRNNALKSNARTAIHFINNCLSNGLNLKGQSVRDAAHNDFSSKNFDDGILHCCLQIRDRRNRAILLSNDVNLRNKLLFEHFQAYSHETIIEKLDPFKRSFPRTSSILKTEEAEERLSHLCSYIICKELRNGYGEIWSKMGSSQKKPPWTLQECLDLFEKYWIPVFGLELPKMCLKKIETFNSYLKAQNGTISNEKLTEFTYSLCIFFKNGYKRYAGSIQEHLNNMDDTS